MVVMRNVVEGEDGDTAAASSATSAIAAKSTLSALLGPASPAMSLGSPVFKLPGSMPNVKTTVQAEPTQQQQQQQQAAPILPTSSSTLPPSSSTSGLTSFFRSFSLSTSSGSPSRSPGSAQASAGQEITVSSKDKTSNASGGGVDAISAANDAASSNVNTTTSTTSGSTITQEVRSPSPVPLTPTSSTASPAFAGGTQVKRAFSNSSAVKRIRKLSNPIPSLLGGSNSNSATRESPTGTGSPSSPFAASPTAHESFRPTMLRYGSKEKVDSITANPNTDGIVKNNAAAPEETAGSGLISSSIGFISSLATFEKLPSVFGFGFGSSGGDKENFPRGEVASKADPIIEDIDLKIEDAAGQGEIYRESSSPPQDRSTVNVNSRTTIVNEDGGDSPTKIRTGGPHTESRARETFEPEGPSRTMTSTTLESSSGAISSSSRHALSPTEPSLTYASTSSISLHNTDELSSNSSTALPLAPFSTPYTPSGNTILDPLTFQTLTRRTSEADVRRVERERQLRGRQLDLLERLHEQAEHPHLRFVNPTPGASHSTPSDSAPNGLPPVSPVKEYKRSKLGLGTPPAIVKAQDTSRTSQSAKPVDTEKPNRRRSLFARIGLSPGSKPGTVSGKRGSSPAPGTSPVPQVNIPQFTSVSSFNSTSVAPSEIGSFQAVAEATAEFQQPPTSPINITESENHTLIRSAGSPRSDGGSSAVAGTTVLQAAAASSKKSRYLKTKLKNKSKRDFGHLFLAQELYLSSSALNQSQPKGSDTTAAHLMSEKNGTLEGTPVATPTTATGDGKSGKKAGKPARPASTWALRFSPDGNYLASAGQDGVIRIWQVISGVDERENVLRATANPTLDESAGTEAGGSNGVSLSHPPLFVDTPNGKASGKKDKRNSKLSVVSTSTQDHGVPQANTSGFTTSQVVNAAGKAAFPAPVFGHKPLHEWRGHTSDVLDVSWSKNNFLLSSSMDKTVRLWHITRKECLCAFQHPDFVTSIAFHPKDDRYFLSGSLDAKLRLWSIPDKKVHCWTQLPELITSVAFTSDGKLACAGTFVGLCLFFDVRDLTFIAKLHSKSARGKNAKGRKITSIVSFPKGDSSEPERILVTSNDSRVRLWDITGICGLPMDAKANPPRLISERHLEAKYKAHENTSSQIKATFSDDGRYVISGSEDRQCYIWVSGFYEFPHPFAQTSKKGADKSPGCESFNPTLLNDSHCPAGMSPGIVTCAIFAPAETKVTLARGGDPFSIQQEDAHVPGKLLRSASHASSAASSNPNETSLSCRSDDSHAVSFHRSSSNGVIILSADDSSGTIRVFRNHPIFDTSSIGRDAKSLSGSAKEAAAMFSSGTTQRRHSQISKVSRSTSRVRSSLERQRRGTEPQIDVEELAA